MNANELIEFINEKDYSRIIPGYNAYAVIVAGKRGVAIETGEEVIIKESFNKVKIQNMIFRINNEDKNVVFLYSEEGHLSKKYGILCLDFIDDSNKNIISTNPLKWFNEWRDLMGDHKVNKMIYDIIGEMAVLNILQKNKMKPVWDSTKNATFDISAAKDVYEVKSSIEKTKTYVTIHNQFQLDRHGLDGNLYIIFVRLEDNDCGESIESLYTKLIDNGFDKQALDKYLEEQGYYSGKDERYKKYLIHEIRKYTVDDDFPMIVPSIFKDGVIPNGIVKYEYTITLDAINYENILED